MLLYGRIVQLKLQVPDGKILETDTANTETFLRIIQSIPSSKAEPFKLWLTKVGPERIQDYGILKIGRSSNFPIACGEIEYAK